jgi:U6 snRNA-associated Sm-like protein LSm1
LLHRQPIDVTFNSNVLFNALLSHQTLRSFDQYSNLVLDESTERKTHRHKDGTVYFSDVPMGVYIVRGDSIVLLGQVAPDDGMKKVEPAELEEMMKGSDQAALEWDFDKDLQA